tara:strand:+ start:73 stop:801 length:729 start_codon:yes stop_codon:yes gene_type:complete
MTFTNKINVLIPAAGRGSRSGLNYPKTLYKVDGKEILLYILDLIKEIDRKPTLIVSPDGSEIIRNFLIKNNRNAELILQEKALGMGNAILQYKYSESYQLAEDIILIWGDIPFIRKKTLSKLIKEHFSSRNDFTLITKNVDKAYTIIERNSKNEITNIKETREEGSSPINGERDIGLFIFKKRTVFEILEEELPQKYGLKTNEHGFLYIIKHLSKRGYKIEGLPIASEKELRSLNYISDLDV